MKEMGGTKGVGSLWPEAPLLRIRAWGMVEALPLATILGVGVALRLLLLDSESLWFDTVHSIALADHSDPAGVIKGASLDFQSPLYFLLLHWWLRINATDLWIRLLSVIFGTATLFMVYQVARALFSKETALLASLLAALSSYQVFYSRYPRGYILLAFLSLVSLYFLYFALIQKGWKHWAAYSLATVLALYTHPYAFFLLFAEGAFAVAFAFQAKGDVIKPWAASQLVILLIFSPWLGATWSQWTREQGGADLWIEKVSPASLKMLYDWLWFKTRGEYGLFWDAFLRVGRYIFTALFLFSFIKGGKIKERSLLLLAWAVPIAMAYGISAMITPVWDPRYFPLVASPFYILVAYAATTTRIEIKNFRVLVNTLAVFLVVGMAVPPLLSLYFDPKFHSQDVRGTAQWLRSQYQEEDVIVHLNYQSYLPSLWYNRSASGGPEGKSRENTIYTVPCIWESIPSAWCQEALYNETYLNTDLSSLPQVAKGAKRIWLVALYNHVWPGEVEITDARVGEVIGDAYRELGRRRFLGVNVYLLSPSLPRQ